MSLYEVCEKWTTIAEIEAVRVSVGTSYRNAKQVPGTVPVPMADNPTADELFSALQLIVAKSDYGEASTHLKIAPLRQTPQGWRVVPGETYQDEVRPLDAEPEDDGLADDPLLRDLDPQTRGQLLLIREMGRTMMRQTQAGVRMMDSNTRFVTVVTNMVSQLGRAQANQMSAPLPQGPSDLSLQLLSALGDDEDRVEGSDRDEKRLGILMELVKAIRGGGGGGGGVGVDQLVSAVRSGAVELTPDIVSRLFEASPDQMIRIFTDDGVKLEFIKAVSKLPPEVQAEIMASLNKAPTPG
jgi:hypothetical protein